MGDGGAGPADLRTREWSLFTNMDAPCDIRKRQQTVFWAKTNVLVNSISNWTFWLFRGGYMRPLHSGKASQQAWLIWKHWLPLNWTCKGLRRAEGCTLVRCELACTRRWCRYSMVLHLTGTTFTGKYWQHPCVEVLAQVSAVWGKGPCGAVPHHHVLSQYQLGGGWRALGWEGADQRI